MEIDGVDRKILGILRENSRTKNVGIAEKVGLTEGAVRNRIEKLTINRIITKFTVETASDERVYGVVMLKAKGPTKKMMREVSSLHIVSHAFEISGEFDGCLVIEADSITNLDAKIDQIRKCPDVADTRTFVAVKKW